MARKHATDNRPGEPLFTSTGSHELVAEHVTQTFLDEGGNEVWALDDFSLHVAGPQIVGIIGPSGCGKSTFLRMVVGLDSPLSGTIEFDGKPVTGPDLQRAMVFQNANLFEWLTVEENIAFGLKANGIYDEKSYKIPRLIEMMGLSGFEDSYPTQISGGMASRCALARTFVLNPGLICFDEPLSALDAFTRSALQDEILAMQDRAHTSMILVTHDIEEAVYLCDRVVVMSPRPGHAVGEIAIDLPHPRDRVSDEFVSYRRQLLDMLREGGMRRSSAEADPSAQSRPSTRADA
ncbi:MAG: ABC transporter ATP-binding protein [Eggerthellaceae bacterium]|jgi:sulfonate transport system ATP-binding protein